MYRSFVSLLCAVAFCAGGALAGPPLQGPLPGGVVHRVGQFAVLWRPHAPGGAQLSVQHLHEPNRTLWASVPGEAFVQAAVVRDRVRGKRGFFRFDERGRVRTVGQHVFGVIPAANRLLVAGALDLQDGQRALYLLNFSSLGPGQLRVLLDVQGGGVTHASLHEQSPASERFAGFGEQFSYVDLRGRRVPIVVQEQGIGRGVQPLTFLLNRFAAGSGGDWSNTYAPMPYYLTSQGRGFVLENSEYSVFDLRGSDAVHVEVRAPALRGRILYGRTPLDVIEQLTAYTGRMQPLPDWIHQGAVIGTTGGRQSVLDQVERYEQARVPVSAYFLQDWVGERSTPFGTRLWWNWEPDAATYPDWPGFVGDLRARGYRVMGYVNPFLSDVASKPGVTRNLFREAESQGFLVRNRSGAVHLVDQAGFKAALVDFSNPAARAWYKQVIKDQLLASGMSGWMGDFGEALPFDALLHTGDATEAHNRYPEAWQQVQREAIAEAGLGHEVVPFSRSGYTRSPGTARLFWAGDQLTSWDRHDGIKTVVVSLLSSGLSGMSLNHADIGGYTTISFGPARMFVRSKELLQRWVELSAFTPVFRTHGGLIPGVGHSVDTDADTLAHFAEQARLFASLFPYRKRLMHDAATRGAPLVRPLWLAAPNVPQLFGVQDQFMLGPDLTVAPVLERGQEVVNAILPPGRWVHLFSGAVSGDPARPVVQPTRAPIGRPAVYVRQGSQLEAELRATGLTGILRNP